MLLFKDNGQSTFFEHPARVKARISRHETHTLHDGAEGVRNISEKNRRVVVVKLVRNFITLLAGKRVGCAREKYSRTEASL